MSEQKTETVEFMVGLALGVERILDDATDLTADEMVETRDDLLALFYSHLDDLRCRCSLDLRRETVA